MNACVGKRNHVQIIAQCYTNFTGLQMQSKCKVPHLRSFRNLSSHEGDRRGANFAETHRDPNEQYPTQRYRQSPRAYKEIQFPATELSIGPLSRTARPVAQAKSSITTSAKLRLPATHKTYHLYNFSR